ncbi:MAG: hypothetical protein ACFFDB_00955 [Promethearchaeota archaeon]
MENEELAELKELSIAKIKVAYNRSIDIEATHLILWDRIEKTWKFKFVFLLILSIIAASSIIFTVNPVLSTSFGLYILISDIFTAIILILIIWEVILLFTGRSIDHGHIVNDAFQLREQSINFLQYKLDNLDKQGYINELISLEKKDHTLKDKSGKYTKRLSSKQKRAIQEKIEELERSGTKKYFMTLEEVDSATEKLQKFTALRTREAWIKFD